MRQAPNREPLSKNGFFPYIGRMKGNRSVFRRLALLAVVGVAIPACGKGIRVSPTLFTDNFNGVFPGTNWTAPALTGSAAVQIDSATGNPMPSLKMTTTATASTASTDTTTAFNNPNLTISVHAAVLSATPSLAGTATISIVDATPAVIASAAWDNATGNVTFTITGTAPVVVAAPAADGGFHRFVFNVSAGGTGSWSLDGGAAAITQAVAPGMLKVRLGAAFGAGTAWPDIFYDTVNVTSP